MIIISAFSAAIADPFLASRPFYRRGSRFLRMQNRKRAIASRRRLRILPGEGRLFYIYIYNITSRRPSIRGAHGSPSR